MKHVTLGISEGVKFLYPAPIEKDLQDNQIICPVCKGYGITKRSNKFGLEDKLSDSPYGTKMNWYDNESLTFCPNCYNGVVTLCEYCGKPIPKGYISKCDCEQYKAKEELKRLEKWNETVKKAKCIDIKNVNNYLYCEENDKYYAPDCIEEFFEDFEDEDCELPLRLWVTSVREISIDACSVIENACDDLHEDASENCDYNSLQKLLNEWCSEQTGTTTYYPCYKEYVLVENLKS